MISNLSRWLRKNRILVAILSAGFIVRILNVGFGLPFHLFGDEEALIYSALQMIQLGTVLPVLHMEYFSRLLYYPPFLSYIYLLLFLPILAFKYILAGFPNLESFKAMLMFNPSIFWYAARALSVVLAVANSYLTYVLTKRIFKNDRIALLAAAFLSLSFLDVTLAGTARHWIPGLFFSLLSLVYAFKSVDNPAKKMYPTLSGIFLGISFGMSYLVFFFPVVLTILARYLYMDRKKFCRAVLCFLFSFGAVAALAVLSFPDAFRQVVFSHNVYTDPAARKTLGGFIKFYLESLLYYEPVLFIFGLIGAVKSFYQDKKNSLMFSLFFFFTFLLIYIFLTNKSRYLVPVIPLLAMLAGAGAYFIGMALASSRKYLYVLLPVLLYQGLVFSRYTWLALRPDTRIQAKEWIEKNIPLDDRIMVYSERLRLIPTVEAAELIKGVNPSALRSIEKSILSGWPKSELSLNSYNLFYFSNDEERIRVLESVLRLPGRKYLAVDDWSLTSLLVDDLVAHRGEMVTSFNGGAVGDKNLFVAGEDEPLREPILKKLFSLNNFGPQVVIYKINAEKKVEKTE